MREQGPAPPWVMGGYAGMGIEDASPKSRCAGPTAIEAKCAERALAPLSAISCRRTLAALNADYFFRFRSLDGALKDLCKA